MKVMAHGAAAAAAGHRLLRAMFFPAETKSEDPSLAFMNADAIIGRGRAIIAIFVVGTLGWAATAPLDSALIAPGVVVVESHRKTLQHLEGGIVREILVAEGQSVTAGQVLMRLDDTQASSSLSLIQGEADALTAQQARLIAERDGLADIAFPGELLARTADRKVAEAMRGERSAFFARQQMLSKQIEVLGQRNEENRRIMAGLKSQQVAVEKQIALIKRETESIQQLYAKGLATLPRLLALQRQTADLNGQRGQLIEKIAEVELGSGENELQIMNLRNQRLTDVVKDLRETETKRFNLADRLGGAEDTLARLTLTAPVAGKVVSLSVHTKGAVIRPGETILEIVPESDQLDIEAHLRPEDADDVHIGMSARINLSAYKQRRLPVISGVVTNISADRLTDQHTGQPYFNVEVTVDRDALKNAPDIRLIPGLPVDVAIETGARTMLSYFTEPVTAAFRKGMRER